MNMKDRIKQIREYYCDGNNEMFAQLLGEKPNTVSNWINRGMNNISVLNKLSNTFPDVDLNWLIRGEGQMSRKKVSDDGYKDEYLKLLKEQNDLNKKYSALLEEMRGRDNEKNTSAGMDSAATDAPGKTGS